MALLGMAGCAAIGAGSQPPPPAVGPAPARPVPRPVAAPVPDETPAHRIVLLYPGGAAADSEIAAAIAARLEPERFDVTLVDVETSGEPLSGQPAAVAVAVGRAAAVRALAMVPGRPVVVCQVFNYQELMSGDAPLWGVHALPPLALQLRGWKAADASLERIGLIVSEAHAALVPEFLAAARQIGAGVEIERSASDRETLYLFKRMAPRIDGLWLLPDNAILSPGVLRELLGYALSHEVGVLGFSEALLPWGALLSARSVPDDVAASVQGVLEQIIAGRLERLERMTPLSTVALDFNPEAARRLGLAIVPDTTWVLHEPD